MAKPRLTLVKIAFTLGLVLLGGAQRTRRGQPAYGGGNNNNNGGYQSDNSNTGSSSPYKFEYGVYDPTYGTEFGHQEERNAQDETVGQYRVRLPDGRLQIVTYRADKNGYRADVVYEGGSPPSSSSSSAGGYSSPSPAQPSPSYGPTNSNNHRGGGSNSNYVKIMRQVNGRSFSHNY